MANLQDVENKLVGLAEAIPQSDYSWRSMEGVRSVSEVLMHVASGNYFYGGQLGVTAPDGMQSWEQTVTDKAHAEAKLKESFAALMKAVASADMSNQETANTVLGVISHCHEHLGQMIAYARSNRVVPPWSQ